MGVVSVSNERRHVAVGVSACVRVGSLILWSAAAIVRRLRRRRRTGARGRRELGRGFGTRELSFGRNPWVADVGIVVGLVVGVGIGNGIGVDITVGIGIGLCEIQPT